MSNRESSGIIGKEKNCFSNQGVCGPDLGHANVLYNLGRCS